MPEEVFGRDAELGMLAAFLHGLPQAPAAVALTGPPGAGKTTLLRTGEADARALGFTVLATLPSHSDVRLAFTGLADLLGPELADLLGRLPPPQRRALGVALLIEDAPPLPPEPATIAAAVRSALAVLAAAAPVLVVIDDVQWLDPPSHAAVSFALRRMDRQRIGLLCAQRAVSGHAELPLDLGRARLRAEVLPVGGLSLGALHRMLRTRLGVSFPHPALRRIEAESGGNPFIALELGRALARRGITSIGTRELPVPDTLSGLVSERLGELPAPVSAALELVAVMPGAPVARYIAAGATGRDLDLAVTAGVLDADRGRLRFAHPLLASAVIGAIPPARRRDLHARAASGATQPEERARHRALAAPGPDAGTAAELAAAAGLAGSRGARVTAAELFGLAAELTPAACPADARQRQRAAAEQLSHAGETRAAATLLASLAESAEPGPERADVLSQLAWITEDDIDGSGRLLDRALAEAGRDPAQLATIRFYRSDNLAMRGDLPSARREAHLALAQAELAGDPALLACSLVQAFQFDLMTGRADERQLDRALALERSAGSLRQLTPPSEVAGIWYLLTGRLHQAGRALDRALAQADADGMEYWRADVLLRMSLLAGRRGELAQATELGAAALELAEQLDLGQLTSATLYACGSAAMLRGQAGAARAFAHRGIGLSRSVGDRAYLLAHEALLGSLHLASGDHAGAAARLGPLVAQLAQVGRRPSTQGVASDAAEALIGAGHLDQAGQALAVLRPFAHEPVTAALAARGRGALAAAAGRPAEAITELTGALRWHAETDPLPVEIARTQLVLGGVQRRLKQRRLARLALTQALATLDAAGAGLWAARARAELARVSGRPPATGELTATERQVAVLIARGLTNRQAATELFVTVRAIESTLTKVYAKLGVRSRTQLAQYLRDRA